MKAIVKLADYKWYDSFVDPPISRNREERRIRHMNTIGGGTAGLLGGTAAGMGAGYALSKTMDPKSRSTAMFGLSLLGAGLGLSTGKALGEARGNHRIFKRRANLQQPLNTKAESQLKTDDEGVRYPFDHFSNVDVKPDLGNIKKKVKPKYSDAISVQV